MAKRVVQRPDWIEANRIKDIYSVSSCISEDFADYIKLWKHNGYWLFNSPEIIDVIASENAIDMSDVRLFYYEQYEQEYDADNHAWRPYAPDDSFETKITKPGSTVLEGYDVVTFSCGTSPECSPLSCNGLAEKIATNSHCLLDSLDTAKSLTEKGALNGEPGPYRIFAVYSVNR